MSRRHVFHTVLLVLVLASCQSDRLEVDVSHIEVQLKTNRFDQDLFEADFTQPESTYQVLYQKYGSFFGIYLELIMRVGPANDPNSMALLAEFTSDTEMLQVYEDIQKIHNPQMAIYDNQFTEAFQRLVYHFEDEVVPEIVYHHSGYNVGIFPTDSLLAIGLDFYVGKDHKVVKMLDASLFPQYARDKMEPHYMVSDALRGLLMVRFQKYFDSKNLLSQSMYYGKIMYCLDALQPSVPDSIKMRYKDIELQWAESNKLNIWKEFANQHMLAETRTLEIQKWLEDGPFTGAGTIPQDSPSRLGVWISWQIVRDYMNSNEEVTLPQLMEDQNYYNFMKYYRPS